MSGVSLKASGSTESTEQWLKKVADGHIFDQLASYGQMGMTALANATPKESGLTASSWTCEVIKSSGSWEIVWENTHTNKGQVIALLLQYGHGTGTGGYVQGRDYINPAMKPVFDKIAEEAWKAVTSA